MSSDKVTISIEIPKDVHHKLRIKAKEERFESVEGYIAHVLETRIAKDSSPAAIDPFDEKEDEEMKKRLRSLGYM